MKRHNHQEGQRRHDGDHEEYPEEDPVEHQRHLPPLVDHPDSVVFQFLPLEQVLERPQDFGLDSGGTRSRGGPVHVGLADRDSVRAPLVGRVVAAEVHCAAGHHGLVAVWIHLLQLFVETVDG